MAVKLPKPIARKVGPLSVWAWALVIVGSYLAYTHYRGSTGGTPVLPQVGSAAQQPSGGGGTAADNTNSDLAGALDANSAAVDRLLAAVQGGSGGGGMGATGSGSGSGADTSASTAPTVDSGTNNAPPGSFGTTPAFPVVASAAAAYSQSSPASFQNADGTYSNYEGDLPGWTLPYGGASPGARDDAAGYYAGPASTPAPAAPDVSRTLQYVPSTAPAASAPTPSYVAPAPVDNGPTVLAPRAGTNVAS